MMASTSENIYVTYVDVDRDLLKVWGQRNRIGATYIERLLLQLLPEFNRSASPSPTRINKGMFCFAKYTDDNYYRARVISRVQGDSVGVLFVDYGNRDVIKLSNIRIQEGGEGDVLAKMSEQAEEYYLARVTAPSTGWTKEIVSEIRRDICYEEFSYQISAQVGDQKILDIQFHNEDFSNYLVKKQLARPMLLPAQRQLILFYCSLVSNDAKPDCTYKDLPKTAFSPSNVRLPIRKTHSGGEASMPLNPGKPNPVNFSHPPPPLQFPQKNLNLPVHQTNLNIPKNYYPSSNQVPVRPITPVLNPLLNPLYQAKDSGNTFNNNNSNIIEILAQQVKQYIANDNAKSEAEAEKLPHHYVNSVLEVGNTYNVIISHIDDGPWSFSIQLLSSETDLQKLMDELSSAELVPVKPPFILGHPCIASSAMYGNLCRGVIVSISRTAVKVYFVDFGNTEDLPSSSIYELPTKFFKIRVLSQKFSLNGLQKVAYSDDIKKLFKEVVQDELLMLRVTSLEGDNLPTCELYLKDKNIKRILNDKMRELRNSMVDDFPKDGDVESVIVTWVVSPQKFFVQLRKRDEDLNALKRELVEAETKGERMTYQQLSVGFKCVCQYESDGQWYRAVITSVDSESAITVFYVDYGNTETVNISLLRKVDNSGLIGQMGNQAIQCSLKGFENKPFDQELASKLEALTLEKEFQMVVASSEKELLCVQLLENGNDISSLLLTATLPKIDVMKTPEKENVWSSPESLGAFMPNRPKKDFVETGNLAERKDGNFRGDKFRFDDKENKRSDKPFTHDKEGHGNEQKSDSQKSWKSRGYKQTKENCDWEHNKTAGSRGHRGQNNDDFKNAPKKSQDGWDDKKNNIFNDKKRLDDNRGKKFGEGRKFGGGEGRRIEKNSSRGGADPKKKFGDRNDKFDEIKILRKPVRKEDIAPPGSKFEERSVDIGCCEKGIVTYYFSPDEFYVQLLNQEEDFKKMMRDIQTYYSDKYSLRDPVKVGDIVIAQFSFDKILYRAEIIKPSPVTVRYVDYGNQEPVPTKGIWPVNKEFLKLPRQVLKCQLAGLQPVGSHWPPPGCAVDKFFEFPEYKCTFLSRKDDMFEISMEALENGKDVASEIIAAGLGRPLAPQLDIPEVDYSLLANQRLRLYVSHVESSSKFYVVVNPEGLEIIDKELKSFSDTKQNLIPLDASLLKPETLCLATSDNISWHRAKITEVNGDKVSVWFCDTGDIGELTTEKVMTLPDHFKDLQPQAIECALYGNQGLENEEEFKKVVEYKHQLISIVSVTDGRLSVSLYNDDGQRHEFDKCSEAPQAIEPISQLPIIGQKLPVVISHLDTAKDIYAQRSSDLDGLGNLSEQLSRFYSEEKEGFEIDEEKIEGTLVAAKSPVSGLWRRGRLVSSQEGTFEVFYVDYGNKETLPRENVKKLDCSFTSLHAFCRKLALDVDFDVEKTEKINNKILELVKDKKAVGYFVSSGTDLMTEFVINGERLSHVLRSLDLVSVNEPDKFVCISGDAVRSSAQEAHSEAYEESEFRVFVSHIDNPNQFWAHKESLINELHEFQDKLQKGCSIFPDKSNVQIDDIVAADFSGLWYRAKVINVQDRRLTVQFIDYGNTSFVDLNYSTVKELTPEFLKVPVFATEMSLKGIWSEKLTSKFEEIILRNEDPVGVLVFEDTGMLLVDLYQRGNSISEMLLMEEENESGLEPDESDLCSVYITHYFSPEDFDVQRDSVTASLNIISERLLDAENFESPSVIEENELYAAKFPEDEAWYRAKVIKKNGNEIEVRFIDYGNTSNVTEIKRLPIELVDIPSLSENCGLVYGNTCDTWSDAACELFAEYADGRELKMRVVVKCGKKSIVQMYHDNKDISEELEAVCEKDGREEVYVSHALSPTDFYIQYVNDDKYKLISEKLTSESEDLKEKEPGTLCQACFAEDGCWYRAKVLQNLGEDGCEVFFIDFGNAAVSKYLKKLPTEIESIPPRALRCSLNLKEKNIPESVKEEFINLTAAGSAVFRARIIQSGEMNVISLKLNGRILEETLNVNAIPDESVSSFPDEGFPASTDDETDDDKNSRKNLTTDSYFIDNSVDDLRGGTSSRNETDEEKRVKISSGGNEGSQESRSDDEKGFSEGTFSSGCVNATDNELMEEVRDDQQETETSNEDIVEAEKSEKPEETQNGNDLETVRQKEVRNKEHKIVPGSISRGETEENSEETSKTLYEKFSEKLVPGSISRGVSLEVVSENGNQTEDEGTLKQASSPNPKPEEVNGSVKDD